jgi:hypothetical protein
MDRTAIERALRDSRKATITTLSLKKKWWPTSTGKKQAEGSAWALAL